MSIGSKPADKLVPYHFRNLHMENSSWELQGMGLPQVSMHKDWLVGFCCHTWWVENGMEELAQGIGHVKET